MCIVTIRTGLVFPRWSIWGITCLRLLGKWTFSHPSPEQPHTCVLKPQNIVRFSETIDLRGHMPRFTQKVHVFPSISLEMSEMCVVTIRTGLIFLRWLIWGVTCLGLLEKWTFSHLSTSKYHKCVLKPSEQGSFFWDDWIWGVTCLGLLEKWIFSHLSPSKCHKCVV